MATHPPLQHKAKVCQGRVFADWQAKICKLSASTVQIRASCGVAQDLPEGKQPGLQANMRSNENDVASAASQHAHARACKSRLAGVYDLMQLVWEHHCCFMQTQAMSSEPAQ